MAGRFPLSEGFVDKVFLAVLPALIAKHHGDFESLDEVPIGEIIDKAWEIAISSKIAKETHTNPFVSLHWDTEHTSI